MIARSQVYIVTLEVPRDESTTRKLRWTLKELGRRHGVRCLAIIEQQSERGCDDGAESAS